MRSNTPNLSYIRNVLYSSKSLTNVNNEINHDLNCRMALDKVKNHYQNLNSRISGQKIKIFSKTKYLGSINEEIFSKITWTTWRLNQIEQIAFLCKALLLHTIICNLLTHIWERVAKSGVKLKATLWKK